jgi:hypothetical protein
MASAVVAVLVHSKLRRALVGREIVRVPETLGLVRAGTVGEASAAVR